MVALKREDGTEFQLLPVVYDTTLLREGQMEL
jgi:hypothetical protein